MEERYRGVHTRRALHRRRMSRRARFAAGAFAVLGVLGVGAAEAGVTPAREENTTPVAAAAPAVTVAGAPLAGPAYDSAAYRTALEQQIGHPLSDTGFAEIEEVAGQVCGWDREEFAGWVAVNTDDGTLADVHLDVSHRCPEREPEITEALAVIDKARKSCRMPKTDDPQIREMTAGRPAQAALTCVLLTKPIA
ncbi:hypothetical protein AB0G04_28710 [Actinoplanes sp. NPDC023801]|uniref:hypothetical protein n=1 Tax=Actinoplanes sp. NPDC023801 TaxID=3154595 RepID=UPI0034116934